MTACHASVIFFCQSNHHRNLITAWTFTIYYLCLYLHSNIKAFIYGKNRKFFNSQLKGKIQYSNFDKLSDALKKIFRVISKDNFLKKTIIFSPSAASFDSFKNFEDRGNYFNNLIKKNLNG